MTKIPYDLSTAKWHDIQNVSYQLAILPWGATEAHNYHLPYGTDTYETKYIAMEAARKAASKAKMLVLPAMPFGVNTGQMDIPGTINMHPSTQASVIRDIVESLDYQSIIRLVILNGHGGNHFKSIIRELTLEFPDMLLATLDWYTLGQPENFFDTVGDHAGEMESSIMMHIAGELVLPLEKAGKGRSRSSRVKGFREGWAWTPRKWTQVSDDTGIGDPSQASPDKGAQYLDHITGILAEFFIELAGTDQDDLYE